MRCLLILEPLIFSVMSSDKTKVLSVRVPADVIDHLDNYCDANNITRSKFLTERLVDRSNPTQLSLSDKVESMPEEVYTLISASGATVVGVATYKQVYSAMLSSVDEFGNKRYTPDQAQFAAIFASVGVGIAGFNIFASLLSD